jgi:hypothetical protein
LTLSAWELPEALKSFAVSGRHAPTSQGLAAQMRDAKFATWTTTSAGLPVGRQEAARRLT